MIDETDQMNSDECVKLWPRSHILHGKSDLFAEDFLDKFSEEYKKSIKLHYRGLLEAKLITLT